MSNTLNVTPPDVASLKQFGDIPVSNYSGIPDISIPLYEIVNGDIKVPIVLKYHSGGIKVNQEAGWVGLGWHLQIGGCINENNTELGGDFGQECFPDPLQTSLVDYYVLSIGEAESLCKGQAYDKVSFTKSVTFKGEPDIITYNFLDHSGRFFYDRDFNFRSVKQSNLLIERGDYFNLFNEANLYDCWTIADDNGTIYFFDDVEKTEIAYEQMYSPSQNQSIFLSSILSANGNSVDFSYSKMPQKQLLPVYSEYITKLSVNNTAYSTSAPIKKYSVVKTEPLILNEIDFEIGRVQFVSSSRVDVHGKKLDQIIIFDNFNDTPIMTVQFEYSYFNGSATYGDFISHFTDPYFTQDMKSKRLKLTAISIKGTGENIETYNFEYYENKQLPYKTSFAFDYWNYFNGKINAGIIPDFSRFNFQLENIFINELGINNNREPDVNYVNAGTLKKVIYPTGGATEYVYEANTYKNIDWLNKKKNFRFAEAGTNQSQLDIFMVPQNGNQVILDYIFECGSYNPCNFIVDHFVEFKGIDPGNSQVSYRFNSNTIKEGKHLINNLLPGNYRITASNPAGVGYRAYIGVTWFENAEDIEAIGPGIRIKEIINYDLSGLVATRKSFSYCDENSITTGKLMSIPIFARFTERLIGNCIFPLGPLDNYKTASFFSNSISTESNNISGQPIGYSYVKELIGINGVGGEKEYYYHNNSENVYYYNSIMPGTPTMYDLANGNTIQIKDYEKVNGNKFIKKIQNFDYQVQTSKEFAVKCESGGNNCNDTKYYFHYFPILYGENQLISRSDVFVNSPNTVITEEYKYNGKFLLSEIEVNTSDGDEIKKTFRYPFEIAPSSPIYNEMTYRNMISTPVQQTMYRAGKVSDSHLTTYKNANGFYVPDKYYKLQTTTPLPVILSYSDTPSSIDTNYGNPELVIDEYDNKGNVLKTTAADGIVTNYIWAYNQNYPVAKIVRGADFSIDSLLRETINNGNFSSTDSLTLVDVDIAFLKSQLNTYITNNNYQVILYTHKPLVGLSSETLPNGTTTYYKYDSFGRLSEVLDHDNRLLKKQTYNYANVNQ
ncbi:MAG: RHS repeat protein [Prolixibacteraceae bacterium]|nr:RHS repeat protein [Prolixibacteraceae bacterium]